MGTLSMSCHYGYSINVMSLWILYQCHVTMDTPSMSCHYGYSINVMSLWILYQCHVTMDTPSMSCHYGYSINVIPLSILNSLPQQTPPSHTPITPHLQAHAGTHHTAPNYYPEKHTPDRKQAQLHSHDVKKRKMLHSNTPKRNLHQIWISPSDGKQSCLNR